MGKLTFTEIKAELEAAKEDLTNKDKTLKTRTIAIVGLLGVVIALACVILF